MCVCACVAAGSLSLAALRSFLLVRPSIHPLLSTAYETHIEWGGRSHHHIHIYESAKLNLLDVIVYGGGENEQQASRADEMLYAAATSRFTLNRWTVESQHAAVPKYDTM